MSALGAAACGAGSEGTAAAAAAEGTGEHDDWTVLHYSMADTDLEPFMMGDLEEMGQVSSDGDVNIVAYVDRAVGYSDDPLLGLPNWEGAKLLHLDDGKANVLEDLGNVNTGDPAQLTQFIERGVTAYPADHYALVISDHGAGWSGVGGDESTGYDGLNLAEMRSGIADGLQAAKLDKLDMLGFDACLMATYEVASAVAPLAERMVASEELEPGHGWDYSALGVLAEDPSSDNDDLGRALVDGFKGQAEDEGTETDITLALLDLTQMPAVDKAVGAFSGALSERMADLAPALGKERWRTLGFGRSPDPSEDMHMADLGAMATQVGEQVDEISDEAEDLTDAIDDVVVDSVDGEATSSATGLSIYFPPAADLLSPEYSAVPSASAWTSLLQSYYAAGASIPAEQRPNFDNADANAESFIDDDGLNLVGTFDPADVMALTGATIGYGVVQGDGSVTFIGEEPATIYDEGKALGIYDLTQLTISDGTNHATAYLGLSVEESTGLATIQVPMAYYAPDAAPGTYQDVLLSLTFDGDTGEIVEQSYYVFDEALGTYGELDPEAAGTVIPEAPQIAADGTETWVPTSAVGLTGKLLDLSYNLEPLPAGTQVFAQLTVTDYGGNSDSVSTTVTVPEQ